MAVSCSVVEGRVPSRPHPATHVVVPEHERLHEGILYLLTDTSASVHLRINNEIVEILMVFYCQHLFISQYMAQCHENFDIYVFGSKKLYYGPI